MTEGQEIAVVAGAYAVGCGAAALWYRYLGKYRFKLAMALLG